MSDDMRNAPSQDDFDAGDWLALARARRHDKQGDWFRLMRRLCGWTSGRHKLNRQMRAAVDAWLERHPRFI